MMVAMESVVFLSEIVAEIGSDKDLQEVCASADATYDRQSGVAVVELKSLTRPAGIVGTRNAVDWLPADQTVKESVPREEASEFARDVFMDWVKKVRAAIPRNLKSAERAT